ncbi:MAG: ComF family protein [Treponema sp.]|jgi:ComF family protein|nr:ComF family protein [Treponema sp.]
MRQNILLLIKNYLFPSDCALCNDNLLNADEIKYGLCMNCKESLVYIEGERCNKCGKPLVSEINTCLSCRKSEVSYDRIWALFPYTGKYKELLTKYKFLKKLPLAEYFAEKILDIINKAELNDAIIVPVPPRPGKKKETGWDQVDYLVKKLKKPAKSVCRCLKRKKSSIQKELNREERIENLKGRIYCNKNIQAPKTALVIDDVFTTGSTMEVCASVLKQNGAEKVYGICLFYD